jgi:hypothetical protein
MFFATDSQIKKRFKICESVANFSIGKLISQSFSIKIKPMHFKFILIYLGVPSFRTSLLRLKQSLFHLERIVLLYLELQFPLSITICAKKRRISIAIGAEGLIIFLVFIFCQSEFISDSNRHCEERGNLLFFNHYSLKVFHG